MVSVLTMAELLGSPNEAEISTKFLSWLVWVQHADKVHYRTPQLRKLCIYLKLNCITSHSFWNSERKSSSRMATFASTFLPCSTINTQLHAHTHTHTHTHKHIYNYTGTQFLTCWLRSDTCFWLIFSLWIQKWPRFFSITSSFWATGYPFLL